MKLNIAVFFGGESVEHEVSIISGQQAINALDPELYNVIPVYVAKDRKMYVSMAGWLRDMASYRDLNALTKKCTQITLANVDNKVRILPVKSGIFGRKELGTIDVAIPVMHGTNGEDGTIQGYFENLKLPYAGCDLYAAAVGQDKVLQKNILHDNGLPITPWFYVYGDEMEEKKDEILKQVHAIGYPVILKPARTGSSVGITVAHNDAEYLDAFDDARQYDEKVITEKTIDPLKEINCSVLGNSVHAEASVLEEVHHAKNDELLSFDDKYKSSGSMAGASRQVPAPLSKELTEKIQDYALKTFRVLGASGVCRIDFLMNADTNEIYVNEINTIPGSLSFYLWTEKNVSFKELMNRLVKLALDRERRRARITFSYDTNLLENFAGGVKGAKGVKGGVKGGVKQF
ncbi:MAG: D-alanine--D-alanine ligase family protein [Lachnospiraceae bacterium]|uniref:D-alanine--D-alanine ligase family protein n=1 Tax=Galactobacillus timonensis TaxID=2041840 RepID=UPI000C8492B2|nr:D-alanine--D-alanine ligase family protein [Galactobacillus timonensis]MDY5222228.1 D-alanine--D-alanine ligase family protein [Lachnospiraceae bacterium]MDY6283363.1 D-alanine--D-alanine ligase family protein [Erysipelotrichaceae bacterium]MCI6753659.1 D-alanine--D-alanine ligase [Galactobacillus timonensis]MDD7087810.1 D-alanine--D-alanine ligase [Galactobacillus timonensis]HCW56317.1 D-alanine--D-alanine ligase [Erysipelotrichaceae bacterium]